MTKQNKLNKRVRHRVYRIAFLGKDGIHREPALKFETYRWVSVAGEKKREHRCFASIQEAEEFRDSSYSKTATSGVLFEEAVEQWKKVYFPHVQPSTRENILKVLPDRAERRSRSVAGDCRQLPCDFFLPIPMGELGGPSGPLVIDEWLAHVKRPEYLATLKKTRISFRQEYEVLSAFFSYWSSRRDREGFRSPLLRDHRKKLKIRDRPARMEKDLPAEKLPVFLRAIEEYCTGGRFEYVMAKLAEIEYRTYSRVSEAAAIHLEDTNPTTGVTVLNKSIQYLRRGEQRAVLRYGHKANGGRVIRSVEVTRLLLEVAMRRGIRSGPLFFVDGKPIPYKAIQNAYDYAHRKAETGQTGTHVLRHAALTEFHAASKDLRQTQKVAGHSDVASTVRYAKARDLDVIESQERVEEKLRAKMASDNFR